MRQSSTYTGSFSSTEEQPYGVKLFLVIRDIGYACRDLDALIANTPNENIRTDYQHRLENLEEKGSELEKQFKSFA